MEKFKKNLKEKPVRTIVRVLLVLFIITDVSRTCWHFFVIPADESKISVMSVDESKDFVTTADESEDSVTTVDESKNSVTTADDKKISVTAKGEREDLAEIVCPTYMIYYGEVNDAVIEKAVQYDLVILHPKQGNITREQVERIQRGGAYVLGYISIGEDLRTNGMTSEQMLRDARFTGDGTGPRIDPRDEGATNLDHVSLTGKPSSAGSGFASYYLDDNDHDGKPDFNPNFNCAYTNMGDPAWFDVLDNMQIDGVDGIAGIREILTEEYGRGLGCDGLFLDTIDTCAPNSFTGDEEPHKTRFEWTAPGVVKFMERLEEQYPEKYILQNRGIFFYNYSHPHYAYSPGSYIDFLMYESYMLDSNPTHLYSEGYFADNKNIYAPKLCAEAGRPDGFQVLSLGYAEGPVKFHLKETLFGESDKGLEILMEDIDQAQNKAGFSHYITDGGLMLINSFVIDHSGEEDHTPPEWSSVHNGSVTWPREEPIPRVGIGQAEPIEDGMIVRWDVAMDRNDVVYTLYYQKEPFDFTEDPDLEKAEKLELVPEVGEGYDYGAQPDTYPYQAAVTGLDSGDTYYFTIRARDCSAERNEEKNTIVLTGTPE